MRELVRAHLDRGHTVCLSSSALTIQVEPVARFLGIPNTLTNRFEVDDDGVLTGGIVRPDSVGPGQGERGAEVRRRTRNRPEGQLFLRRRQRGRRADVPGWQSAAHQSRGQDGRRRAPTRLAHSEVQQPGRHRHHRHHPHPRGSGLRRSHRRRRRRVGTAHPQPAPRGQLLHRPIWGRPCWPPAACSSTCSVGRTSPRSAPRCSSSTTATTSTRSSPRRWCETTSPEWARRNSRATRSSGRWAS